MTKIKIGKNILESVGSTSLIRLEKIVPNDVNIYLKAEWQNPTGSMKDRMAQAMVEAAEKDGRLQTGGTVIEYTGGSTGTSLAFICAVKGYKAKIVSSDAFSLDKIKHMRRLGAEVIMIPSHGKGISGDLLKTMIEKAKEIQQETDGYWTNQLSNFDQIKGYHSLGEEIYQQTNGQVDVFIQSFGSSASTQGTAYILKEKIPDVKIIAVEPSESPVITENKSGAHGIDGIGAGFIPEIFDDKNIDEVVTVSTDEAINMTRELAEVEGIFVGTSTGSNVFAAIRQAKKMKPGTNIVTIGIDSGLKYLSDN